MPIHTIAQYRVKSSGVDKVKRAIAEFVAYVRANEPGTDFIRPGNRKTIPRGWCIFSFTKMKLAHATHASSEAVKRFEAAYGPELMEGNVIFTDYEGVATTCRSSPEAGICRVTFDFVGTNKGHKSDHEVRFLPRASAQRMIVARHRRFFQ
jgi:quinol monooxygenase YgiN